MKVTANGRQEFTPVELNITFESEEEVAMFFELFNFSFITMFVREHSTLNTDAIRESIKSALGRNPKYEGIHIAMCKEFSNRKG